MRTYFANFKANNGTSLMEPITGTNKSILINWLDPSNSGSNRDKELALIEMWNFLCEEEREEERLYGELE